MIEYLLIGNLACTCMLQVLFTISTAHINNKNNQRHIMSSLTNSPSNAPTDIPTYQPFFIDIIQSTTSQIYLTNTHSIDKSNIILYCIDVTLIGGIDSSISNTDCTTFLDLSVEYETDNTNNVIITLPDDRIDFNNNAQFSIQYSNADNTIEYEFDVYLPWLSIDSDQSNIKLHHSNDATKLGYKCSQKSNFIHSSKSSFRVIII